MCSHVCKQVRTEKQHCQFVQKICIYIYNRAVHMHTRHMALCIHIRINVVYVHICLHAHTHMSTRTCWGAALPTDAEDLVHFVRATLTESYVWNVFFLWHISSMCVTFIPYFWQDSFIYVKGFFLWVGYGRIDKIIGLFCRISSLL